MVSPSSSRRDRFLLVAPLTAKDKRRRQLRVLLVFYAFVAILVILLLEFSKETLWIGLAWWFTISALYYRYKSAVTRARLEKGIVTTDEERVNAKKDLSKNAMRRMLPFAILSCVGFFMAGFYVPLAFALAGFMFVVSLGLFVWARANR